MKIYILLFLILNLLTFKVNSDSIGMFIEFEVGKNVLTNDGKRALDTLGSIESFQKKELSVLLSPILTKETYEKNKCLSLKRYRYVVQYLHDNFNIQQNSLRFIDKYDYSELGLEGLSVGFGWGWETKDISIPYSYISMSDDLMNKLNEIGKEIRCNEDFFSQHTLQITPFQTKTHFDANPCYAIEILEWVYTVFDINFKLYKEDLGYILEDTMIVDEDNELETPGFEINFVK